MRSYNKVSWSKLSIRVPSLIAEDLGSLLMGLGASGVEEKLIVPNNLPLLNRHLGQKEIQALNKSNNVLLDAYFRKLGSSDLKKIAEKIKFLQISTSNNSALQIHHEIIQDKNWMDEWKKGFKPIKVGKNLVVSPSWFNGKNKTNEIVIYLDPGLAFGTGHHSSTRACLKFMEKELKSNKNASFLDVGTGSGILAIAAAKLGAGKIIAIDIDDDAIIVSKKNAASNNVSPKIIFSKKPLESIKSKFNLIVSNILLQEALNHSLRFRSLLLPRGRCIVSGILDNQENDIINEYVNKNSFKLIRKELDKEWITFVFEKV